MNFTQLDMVTLFPPPGTTAGVRVGWVQGDINGTITMNSILTASPPTFTATGTAVIVDTNGDQLFVNVAFTGTFAGGAPAPALYAVAGSFSGTYTVTGGTGQLATKAPAGTVFNGNGVAVQPQVAPPGPPTPAGFGPGAAFSQFTSSLKGGPKPK